jgi:hypothetical protein
MADGGLPDTRRPELGAPPRPDLEILDASIPEQRQRWVDLWQSWPVREATAHPAYVTLVSRDVDRAVCAAMSQGRGGILFPFVVRPLAAEDWAVGEDLIDIVTPYGFGGAYHWSVQEPIGERFWDCFENWAHENRVVTSTARLSLFPEDIVPFRGNVHEVSSCVVRTLGETMDQIWMSYEHKVRKNVKRARESELSVELDTSGSRLDEFMVVYGETMERNMAGAFYRFAQRFFEELFEILPEHVALMHVSDKRRVVSTELLLLSETRAYSFLGGTRSDAFALRPNDLLKHEIIRWAKEEGKEVFVLGGGPTPGDGIFRYKRSFAPLGVVPFRIGAWVHDRDGLERLMRLRACARRGKGGARSNSFFPPYRA